MTQDVVSRFRSIAGGLAAAALITDSPTIIDRVANALNSEVAIKAMGDMSRVLEGSIRGWSGIFLEEVEEKEKGYRNIHIVIDEGNGKKRAYKIPSALPTAERVREFIEQVSNNINIARSVGALASTMLLEARVFSSEMEESEKKEG